MIIRFSIDLPFAVSKECEKEMKKIIKEEVHRTIQVYGVFEVVARVRPKGAEEKIEEEEEPFGGRKFWFEEAMEGR